MASGMNGQRFQFVGYLPIDVAQRTKAIRDLENESRQHGTTQIFIETPYRNNQLLETLTKLVSGKTRICVAVDLTAPTEGVQTKTAQQWKTAMPQLHKRPAIFLLQA
jgi:16S rRNA (cytidine1402-2'-O)-methyltransferase